MDCAVELPAGIDSGPGPIIRGVVDSSVFSIAADVVEIDEDIVAEGDLTASELVGKTISDPAVIISNMSATGRKLLSESPDLSRFVGCISAIISSARIFETSR